MSKIFRTTSAAEELLQETGQGAGAGRVGEGGVGRVPEERGGGHPADGEDRGGGKGAGTEEKLGGEGESGAGRGAGQDLVAEGQVGGAGAGLQGAPEFLLLRRVWHLLPTLPPGLSLLLPPLPHPNLSQDQAAEDREAPCPQPPQKISSTALFVKRSSLR